MVSGGATPDLEIHDVVYNSNCVSPGALFVAVPSVRGGPGGAQHIEEAVRRGAVAVVAAPETSASNVPVIAVGDPRAALADLAARWFGYPSRHLDLFGVTGTDGKTTTTYLLHQILEGCGMRAGLLGTVETRIGPERVPNPDRMTTPESLDVQRLLAAMVDAGVTHAAMEVSSHALALDRVRECCFSAVALTNVTSDHVEFHGSRAAYIDAKLRLFSDVANGCPSVLNRHDALFERFCSEASGPVVSYGIGGGADLRAVDLDPTPIGTSFTIAGESEHVRTGVRLPGGFNVLNALAAAGLALTAGLPLDAIGRALAQAETPPGRMQHVDAGQPFSVIVDYAHTAHAFRSTLEALRSQTDGRLIAVFGAAGNRDRAKRPELARIASEYTDFFFITNEDPFGEDADGIIAEIAAGADPAERGHRYAVEPDRERAIERAISLAADGDVVVITGKGHERSIATGSQRAPWSDAEVALRLLGGT